MIDYEKQFPVVPNDWRNSKEYVPFWIVAKHAEQCLMNTGHTVQRMADLGGLTWPELLAVLMDAPYVWNGIYPRDYARTCCLVMIRAYNSTTVYR